MKRVGTDCRARGDVRSREPLAHGSHLVLAWHYSGACTQMGATKAKYLCRVVSVEILKHCRLCLFFAGLEDAQMNSLRTAKALAMTAIDLYCEKGLLSQAKADLAEDLKSEGCVS